MSRGTKVSQGAVAALAAAALGWAFLSPSGSSAAAGSPLLAGDDRALGRQIAGKDTATPLPTPDTTQELAALAAGLRFRGVRRVSLVGGTAVLPGIQVVSKDPQATVIVGDATSAQREISGLAVSGKAPEYGLWITPELFERTVLDTTGPQGEAAPPLQVVLPVDPLATLANGYLGALANRAPARTPSYEGFLGWIDAHPKDATPPTWQLYVSGAAAVLPPSLGHNHDTSPDWIGIGGVNVASPVLHVS